jgi:hypothetical protein
MAFHVQSPKGTRDQFDRGRSKPRLRCRSITSYPGKLVRRSTILPTILILSAAAFVARSVATPITFTHSGSGSGSIGAAFGTSPFTITAIGDTDNRVDLGGGVYFIDHNSALIVIDGVGTFNFITPTRTFFNDGGNIPGFSRAGPNGLDLFNGPQTTLLDGWDMLSSVGPLGGTLFLSQWTNTPVLTDGGQLIFANGSSQGSFTAVVGQGVPDGSSVLGLIAVAFAGLVALRRRLSR